MNAERGTRIAEHDQGTASWRLFIALPVPVGVKVELQQVQQELRSKLPSGLVSWTRPDNMHLTLRFLGEVREDAVHDLEDRLRGATTGFGRLELICKGIGSFPDLQSPRVVWAGVKDAHDQLARLAARINETVTFCAAAPPEASFIGHITLARIRRLRHGIAEPIAALMQRAGDQCLGTWTADRMELVRSERFREGSRYTTLAAFALGGGTDP